VFGLIVGLAAALFLVPQLRSVVVGAPWAGPRAPASAKPVPTPEAVASAAVSAAEDKPALIDLTIEARPSTATIYFDDEPLGSNPATKRVPRDSATHRVRAEARLYESQSVDVMADKDTVVTIALDRAAAGREGVASAGPKPVEPAPTSTPSAAGSSTGTTTAARPKESSGGAGGSPPSARDRIKNLDKSNPWEQ
jgi:hypothetical protein